MAQNLISWFGSQRRHKKTTEKGVPYRSTMRISQSSQLLNVLVALCILLRSTSSVSPRQPIGSSLVADWVKGKCGESGERLWRYHGSLYDPLDGRKVATVEGLEWVSLLRQSDTADRPIYTEVLNHPNATWKNAASLWSKHLFCYTLGDGSAENSTLLRSIRIRPYSPERPIPLEQAAAVYETASTFIETSNGELIVHSEWSSPHQTNRTISIWGSANVKRSIEDGSLGFSVYCKRRSPKSPFFLPNLSPKAEDSAGDAGNATITVSPRRAKWVQFGMSNMDTTHKYGARETYSLSSSFSNKPSRSRHFRFPWMPTTGGRAATAHPKLTYSRYGEGPPFYAPGRMCMLELQAEPIDGLQDASPILQRLLKDSIQGWDSRHFGQDKVCFIPSGEDDDPLRVYKGYAITAWEKARSVCSLVSFFRKEKGFWNRQAGV